MQKIKKEIKIKFENIIEYFQSQRYYPTKKNFSIVQKEAWLKEISKSLIKKYPACRENINNMYEKSIMELE